MYEAVLVVGNKVTGYMSHACVMCVLCVYICAYVYFHSMHIQSSY